MPALWFLPAAWRDLLALNLNLRRPILDAALALQHDPRPRGYLRVEGSNYWRIRVGNYRIIYLIDEATDAVTVVRIAHRREAY